MRCDRSNLAIEFYNSDQARARDTVAVAGKSSIPLVANGKVFMPAVGESPIYGPLP